MRRPNRIIEIFSMSVLDLFASALAAFIMISVILFPYFNKHQQLELLRKEEVEKDKVINAVEAKLADTESKLDKIADEIKKSETFAIQLKECENRASACKAALTKTFLVVIIEWDDLCDIDLYISDPKSGEYSYAVKSRQGSAAELSADMLDGPGTEIWNNPDASEGDYKIGYRAASCRVDRTTVRGWVIDRADGKRRLRDRVLTKEDGVKRDIALVRVTGNGEALLQEIN